MTRTFTKQGKRPTRNTNIEILRFLLIMGVCFWHIIVHGYNFKEIGTTEFSFNGSMLTISFLSALFSPAVYCFMFISGWYGIKFSVRKFCFFAFLGVTIAILSLISKYLAGYSINFQTITSNIFPIACHKWWFLTGYTMVYLIAPFINIGFEKMDKKTIKQIVWIMTYLEIASLLSLHPNSGSSFYGLLYIYVLARYLRNINFTCSLYKLLFVYTISLLLLSGGVFWGTQLSGKMAKLSFIILSYNNPLIIVMATSIFLIVKSLKPIYITWINICLSNVLIIYLLTEAFGSVLYKYEAELFDKSFLQGLLFSFGVSAICLILGWLLRRTFDGITIIYNAKIAN